MIKSTSTRKRPVRTGVWVIIGLVWLAFAAGITYWSVNRTQLYQQHVSDDQRYRLVVYRYQQLFAFPGQAGDAPGRIDLVTASGTVVRSQPVEMVQLANDVIWTSDRVAIKLVLDWELP